MKQIAMVVALSVFGVLFWLLSYRLSSDALNMAIGLLFGLAAGVPTLLLVLSSQRRPARRGYDDDDGDDTPVVYITYNVTNNTDNRQLTVPAVEYPQWSSMPLIADRRQEIQVAQQQALARR